MARKKEGYSSITIAYNTYGHGAEKILVVHDWFNDSTSYDTLKPYLNTQAFTYCFVDLRGYGSSKNIPGECSVEEATQDLLSVVDTKKWSNFHIIGHSMGGMIAQYLMLKAQNRVLSCTTITPVPACGSPIPDEVKLFLEAGARNDDNIAAQIIDIMTSHRYGKNFQQIKIGQWRKCSLPEARIAYLHMFSETNFVHQIKGLKTPLHVICSKHDAEGYREDVMKETFAQWYPNCKITVLEETGHYPMQEVPVALAFAIENFIEGIPQ